MWREYCETSRWFVYSSSIDIELEVLGDHVHIVLSACSVPLCPPAVSTLAIMPGVCMQVSVFLFLFGFSQIYKKQGNVLSKEEGVQLIYMNQNQVIVLDTNTKTNK